MAMAVVYTCLSIGILQTTHICMGRVSEVSYFSVEEKKCPCFQSLGKDMDCCDDEHALIQLDDDQQLSGVKVLAAPLFVVIAPVHVDFASLASQPEKRHALTAKAPPPPREGLYKIHCSFVFYGDEELG